MKRQLVEYIRSFYPDLIQHKLRRDKSFYGSQYGKEVAQMESTVSSTFNAKKRAIEAKFEEKILSENEERVARIALNFLEEVYIPIFLERVAVAKQLSKTIASRWEKMQEIELKLVTREPLSTENRDFYFQSQKDIAFASEMYTSLAQFSVIRAIRAALYQAYNYRRDLDEQISNSLRMVDYFLENITSIGEPSFVSFDQLSYHERVFTINYRIGEPLLELTELFLQALNGNREEVDWSVYRSSLKKAFDSMFEDYATVINQSASSRRDDLFMIPLIFERGINFRQSKLLQAMGLMVTTVSQEIEKVHGSNYSAYSVSYHDGRGHSMLALERFRDNYTKEELDEGRLSVFTLDSKIQQLAVEFPLLYKAYDFISWMLLHEAYFVNTPSNREETVGKIVKENMDGILRNAIPSHPQGKLVLERLRDSGYSVKVDIVIDLVSEKYGNTVFLVEEVIENILKELEIKRGQKITYQGLEAIFQRFSASSSATDFYFMSVIIGNYFDFVYSP